MKLLIQKDLYWSTTLDPSRTDAEDVQESYRDLAAVANKFHLSGSFVVLPDLIEFRIFAQKVTVDEVAMNEFFADFLTELFEVEVRYAALGGRGCDFALALTSAKARGHQ